MTTKLFSEAISKVGDKYYEEAENYHCKKHGWVKWSAMAACLTVVLFTAFSVLPNYFHQQGTTPPNNPNGVITDTSDHAAQSPGDGGAELVVNQLDAAPFMVDVDVKLTHYDKIPYDAWKLIEEDFYIFANISYDDFVTRIPEKFRMNMNFYSLATKGYKDSGQDDEYRLHDYVFDCQSDEGVKVTIALCNFEAPIRDSFIHDENPEVSSVNGTPVTIYGYDNMYMVNFSYEGVNYDIETRDIELNQLQELLTNIMC